MNTEIKSIPLSEENLSQSNNHLMIIDKDKLGNIYFLYCGDYWSKSNDRFYGKHSL